jgi:uncharacterized protein (DUF486 family)
LYAANVSATDMKTAGYSSNDLFLAGYTLRSLVDASYSAYDITVSGYKAADFKTANLTITSLLQAGFSAYYLKYLGYTASELHSANVSATNMKTAGYPSNDLFLAGYTLTSLVDASYSAYDITVSGYKAADFKTANLTITSLLQAGFSAYYLKYLGYTASELRSANVSATDMKTAGYSAQQLQEGGYSESQLMQAGFSSYDISSAGYNHLVSDCCFAAGSIVKTDQGMVAIENIDTTYHTILNEQIIALTKTFYNDKYLMCFEKHSFLRNVPNKKLVLSPEHKIKYFSEMVKSKYIPFCKKLMYQQGQMLYNILLPYHSKINVNNVWCETLHPNHSIARFVRSLQAINVSNDINSQLVQLYNETMAKRKAEREVKHKAKTNVLIK